MRLRSIVVLAVAFVGCSDVITTEFASVQEARFLRAFDRGWIPPIVPDSAKSIIERNDLDSNSGSGRFMYDIRERRTYIDALRVAGATLEARSRSDVLILESHQSRWEIELVRDVGEATWSTRVLK